MSTVKSVLLHTSSLEKMLFIQIVPPVALNSTLVSTFDWLKDPIANLSLDSDARLALRTQKIPRIHDTQRTQSLHRASITSWTQEPDRAAGLTRQISGEGQGA